ncbi:MAG: SOS response-associated peptidase [Corynebacterium sp.]|nr:SOS response-associated peptidase [Corynebacterium sp.]
MCGRYVMFSTTETLLETTSGLLGEQVGLVGPDGFPPQSWNVAPTHTVGVVRRYAGAATLGPATWGYRAPWKKGLVLFNARGESVFDKSSFRGSEPCLFVMDGWYEWKDRQPHYVSGDAPLLVAGLCRPGGDGTLEATMVTTASAEPVAWLHERMPRVLGADETAAWLDGGDGGDGGDGERRALAATVASDDVRGVLRTGAADRAVGNVAANGPELIAQH